MSTETDTAEIQLIDVKQAFASKNAKLAKRLPPFIIRYLKRIVHQDEFNDFLKRNGNTEGIEFLNAALNELEINSILEGMENITDNTRLIFASNHPLGGIDGLCLLKTIAEKIHPGVRSISNDLLMNIKQLRSFMVGVNKHGGNVKEYVAEMQRVFDSEAPVIFFASGLVSRRHKGKIEDVDWKGTFVKKAVLHQRDVIPVFISGRVSNFFYRLANIRKFLRIRSNIEMLYLPDEMFKQKGLTLTIRFGKPIPWQSFDHSKNPEQWAEYVKRIVYRMGEDLTS